MNLTEINRLFSRVSIRQKGNYLYVRGIFPNKEYGRQPKRYEIALQCKATDKELAIAIAKAKEIDNKLLCGLWQWEKLEVNNRELTVLEAVEIFTQEYWQKNAKTTNREYSFKVFYQQTFGYLPEDELLNVDLIIRAIKSFPSGSYNRQKFIDAIKPLANRFKLDIDYSKYGKYKAIKKDLPKLDDIIQTYQNERNLSKKWLIGVFFTYGLRPHEIFRSEFLFGQKIPIIKVGQNTKTGKRTVYPLQNDDIDYLNLEIPKFTSNLKLPNTRLGHQIGKKFIKYPFTVYDLRHYYAVRGAMNGISPVTMSKWMGHSLNQHFKSYASLLDDIESDQIWKNKFLN